MNCKICNNTSIHIQQDVYKCLNCFHIYVNFLGDPIEYHKTEYRKNNYGTRSKNEVENEIFTKKFHDNRKSICNKRILKIENMINECDSMFDIGAGGGTFLNEIGKLISFKECQEISDICIKNLKMQGYKTYTGDFCNIDIPNKYDLVTCFHVLEHINDLKKFVKSVLKITNKYLIIEVPINRKIPTPNISWDGHYHYFSKESINYLFKPNFEIISIENGIQSPSLLVKLKTHTSKN